MSTPTSVPTGDLTGRLFQMISRRSASAAALIQMLCHYSEGGESRLFVVGGLVRDLLLVETFPETVPLDIDLAVDGDLGPLHAALSRAAKGSLTIHSRFGTASVTLPDGTRVDLARTRSERYSAPGALPVVTPAPIAVDLGRRDFTINAAAVELCGETVGRLIDPHGGARDLERRLIRTLHPASFRDDPTRLIRAARYASRIDGTIARRTWSDARRDRGHLAELSAKRFGDAWRLLLNEADAASALSYARQLKISQSREPRWFVPKAALHATETTEQFWAAIGLLSAESEIVNWLPDSVGMHRRERGALKAGAHLRRVRRSIGGMRRPSSVAKALGQFSDSALQAAERLWDGAAGVAVSGYLERRSGVRSPISAQRLAELGVPPGPRIGAWLASIDAAIWDGELAPDDPSSVTRMEQRIRCSR